MIKYTVLYIVALVTMVLIATYDSSKEIYVTSMGNVKHSEVLKTKEIIESYYKDYNVTILPSIDLISDSKIEGLNKYKSDKILNSLEKIFPEKNGRVMVLTDVNICTYYKKQRKDNNVMGHAVDYGKYSVVSTYGMKRNVNGLLKKVVIHELAHNFGLYHCTSDYNCLMNCEKRVNEPKGNINAIFHVNDYLCESCTSTLKYSKNFNRQNLFFVYLNGFI
jgi:predicted Zn-dependent protease